MTSYALWIWDDDHDMHIHELGEFDNSEQAVQEAQRIMFSAHKVFVVNDNPCWQVGLFRSLKLHSVAKSENQTA